MPKTLLDPLEESIKSALPADWDLATERDTERVKSGLYELLTGMGCKSNGEKIAVDSVASTVWERIKAVAITRRVNLGARALAAERGVDIARASAVDITVASTADEINSLIAVESRISDTLIAQTVTNEEMAAIQTEQVGRNPAIRDPGWQRDIAQFVRRAVPHQTFVPNPATGLIIAQTVALPLTTIQPEVDGNGEICAWIYSEPVV